MSSQQIKGEIGNLELLEALYQQFKNDPNQLHPSWSEYFKSLDENEIPDKSNRLISSEVKVDDQAGRMNQLIETYRTYGHLAAKINPIALKEITEPSQLNLNHFDFQPDQKMIENLRALYCGHIGFEYKGVVQNQDLENWLQQQIESQTFQKHLSIDQKKIILEYLNRSEIFESFLHTKYVGQKRFSLEGAETLIPMLALLIENGAENGLEEVVLGMAHRGRLNVLSNILNKPYPVIFSEFEEGYIAESFEGTGDVKYHKGYISDAIKTHTGKKIKVTLPPNPSHLESVDPVVEGETRAKQFLMHDEAERQKIIPILVHGDAALSGQGVIYETLQFCRLPGYQTGGTLHFVINNQIGFTTIPKESRSTTYCTDIARAFGAPIFHVNAEFPEDCILATFLAFEIRQKFHCDVFIDLNCYRKYGHNESDEPAFTQPLEYQLIRKKRPIREVYRDQLIQQGMLEKEMAEKLESDFKKGLQAAHKDAQQHLRQQKDKQDQDPMKMPSCAKLCDSFYTGVSREVLRLVAERFLSVPPDFRLHPKLDHLIRERYSMAKGEKSIDWGMGEYLAYATLLWEGVPVRLSGQDSGRGTFSHRHAIWIDQREEKVYFPLAHLKEGQGRFEVWNSPLSEFAVLGFEYGYSVACPQGLTIWEAQFGDFGNGAQVIIDQYIASGEQKWGQQSGLTLLLPHGYEGQGPEHSSGRLERFLSLAGHDNIQIVNPTTPAQFFHLLRRQVLRQLKKPLVVFTPKGLLRHFACVNALEEFEQGAFQEILDDPSNPSQVQRLVLCSGRLYYDLIAERDKRKFEKIAFVRIEQLYPLHQSKLREVVEKYKGFQDCYWVQEEPKNMGAWHFIRSYLEEILIPEIPLHYIGRPTSASPATGSHSRHHDEHLNILNQVFLYEK
jgi:2-oxoglutarate dehydrogenase E1 component